MQAIDPLALASTLRNLLGPINTQDEEWYNDNLKLQSAYADLFKRAEVAKGKLFEGLIYSYFVQDSPAF